MERIKTYCYDTIHFMIKKKPLNYSDSKSAAGVVGEISIDLRGSEFSSHFLCLNNTVGLNMTMPLCV